MKITWAIIEFSVKCRTMKKSFVVHNIYRKIKIKFIRIIAVENIVI